MLSKQQCQLTAGMILPDGAMLDLLAGERLLLYARGRERIGGSIEYAGKRYGPAPLPADYQRALRLPDRTVDYGSVESLVRSIAAVIGRDTELDAQSGLLIAAFVLSTWVWRNFCPLRPF